MPLQWFPPDIPAMPMPLFVFAPRTPATSVQ